MKTSTSLIAVYVASLAAVHAQGVLRTLTFDDVSTSEYVVIQNGYGGLQWNNFYIQNGLTSPGGFSTGAASAPNVAFNGSGNPASISGSIFTFNSAFLTAVYVPTLQIRVQGFGPGVFYDNTYTVNNAAPTLINFNYEGVNELWFAITTTPAGILALDDLVFTIPEPGPSTLLSLAAVVGTLSWLAKRGRNRRGA